MGTLITYITPSGVSKDFWSSEPKFSNFEFDDGDERDEFAYKNVDFITNLRGMNYGYPLIRWFFVFVILGGAPAAVYAFLGIFKNEILSQTAWVWILIAFVVHGIFLYMTIKSVDKNRNLFEESVNRFENKLISLGGRLEKLNVAVKLNKINWNSFKDFLIKDYLDKQFNHLFYNIKERNNKLIIRKINVSFQTAIETIFEQYFVTKHNSVLEIEYTSCKTLFNFKKNEYEKQIKDFLKKLIEEFKEHKKHEN